jgi:hypothetical protein
MPLAQARVIGALSPEQQAFYDNRDVKNKAIDANLEGEKYKSDTILAAHKLTADSTRDLNAAHANYFRAMSDPSYLHRQETIAAMKDQTARQKEQDKLDHEILTNGFGVAPTPQALTGYRNWQKSLVDWDRQISPVIGSLAKSYDPAAVTKIKSAIAAYGINPTDKDALKQVNEAKDILTQGGKGRLPDWFNTALSMPRFDTKGLTAWKQPAIAVPGA